MANKPSPDAAALTVKKPLEQVQWCDLHSTLCLVSWFTWGQPEVMMLIFPIQLHCKSTNIVMIKILSYIKLFTIQWHKL